MVTVNNPCRNQPSERDQRARQRLQQRASDFCTQFYSPVFLSVGPEARRDIHDIFDPDKPISFHLDPPSTKKPPLVKIVSQGNKPIYTTDLYFTNVKLPLQQVSIPPKNKDTPTGD